MPITLGQIAHAIDSNPNICGLERVYVRNIDGELCSPGKICSWRGVYRLACLQPELITTEVIVNDFIKDIREAMSGNKVFQGWKGGDYTFNTNTDVWYAYEGDDQDAAVAGVEFEDGAVYIVIAHEVY